MKTKIELKPCPFCGGGAKLQQDIRYPRPTRRKRRAYEVFCTNPECFLYHVDENYFLDENEAIEAWNRRVGNK